MSAPPQALEGEHHGNQAPDRRPGPGRAADRPGPARRRRTARSRPHPAHRPAADGRPPHRADPPQGQPEGRLRLPRLRLARGRQTPHGRVLRERRQGRRRGGDPAPRHPRLLRRAHRRRPRHPQRLLARPAGTYHPARVPARGSRPLRGRDLGTRLRDHRRGTDRALLPRRGALLHLGPHQQRNGVPPPAPRPRVRHQQPARLLQHVPRVVRLRPHRDHRDRQGQRQPRRPPPGRPDHRRRTEPRHQPPPDALGPRTGQDRRGEDHLGEPAARSRPRTVQEPPDGPRHAQGRRPHRPLPPDPHRRRPRRSSASSTK